MTAIFFTYENQKLDRYYREASIRPLLKMSISDDGGSLNIRNDGNGPAVLTDMDFTTAGEFTYYIPSKEERERIESGDKYWIYRRKTEASIQNLMQDALGRQFLSGVEEYWNDPATYLNIVNFWISSLPAGQTKTIFKIDKSKLKEIVEKSNSENKNVIKNRIDRAVELFLGQGDIRICYCSITSFYCTGLYNKEFKNHRCEEKSLQYTSKFLEWF